MNIVLSIIVKALLNTLLVALCLFIYLFSYIIMYKRNDDYENNIAQYLYTVLLAIYIVHSEALRRQQIIVNNVYDVI